MEEVSHCGWCFEAHRPAPLPVPYLLPALLRCEESQLLSFLTVELPGLYRALPTVMGGIPKTVGPNNTFPLLHCFCYIVYHSDGRSDSHPGGGSGGPHSLTAPLLNHGPF